MILPRKLGDYVESFRKKGRQMLSQAVRRLQKYRALLYWKRLEFLFADLIESIRRRSLRCESAYEFFRGYTDASVSTVGRSARMI